MSEPFFEGNQENQNSWTASAGGTPGYGAQTPMPGQGYQQPGNSQGMSGNQGGGLLGGAMGDVRQTVENQIYQAIDHYGSQVPGGERFTPEAKNAVSGILDNLQRQLEGQAASRMGGLGSGLFGEGGNQSGGSL